MEKHGGFYSITTGFLDIFPFRPTHGAKGGWLARAVNHYPPPNKFAGAYLKERRFGRHMFIRDFLWPNTLPFFLVDIVRMN